MRGVNSKGEVSYLKPTPLTDAEYKAMVLQHKQEREDRLALLDNRIVEAKLYYYKGVRPANTMTREPYVTTSNLKDIYTPDLDLDGYARAVVIGTERQRVSDDTFVRVTGIYSLNLTERMLKAYEENNNQLIIQKQY
tara:strand:+ start:268 stop:678 length:411 start_codon:yes stop_codon:yes gene_type:complete